MNLGQTIQDLRKKKGLTRNKLADKANVSCSFLRNIEINDANISIQHLERICYVLNISLSDLFTIAENKKTYIDGKKEILNMLKTYLISVEWAVYSDIEKLIENEEEHF